MDKKKNICLFKNASEIINYTCSHYVFAFDVSTIWLHHSFALVVVARAIVATFHDDFDGAELEIEKTHSTLKKKNHLNSRDAYML